MSIFDISLLIILIGFTLNGLFKGIIRLVGHVVALIVGAYVAGHYYLWLFAWGKDFINGRENLIKILSFIILFLVVTKLVALLFVMLEKIFKFIAFIPFTKYINNLLGAALGFIEGSLILGLILYVVSRYTVVGNLFGDQLAASQITPFLLKMTGLILPLLPHALKALQTII